MIQKVAIRFCSVVCLSLAAVGSATAECPNVLFIIADDLATRLACYGDPVAQSPNLDRLAERGVLFQNAFTQYPTCGPSRASLFSGRYPFETGYLTNTDKPYDASLPELTSLPRLFRESGYFTARVGKLFHMGIPEGIGEAGADDSTAWDVAINNTGWDAEESNWLEQAGSSREKGRLRPAIDVIYADPEIGDGEMADGAGLAAALALLRENDPAKTGRPFFLAYGIYRPHPPMLVPKRHWDAIDRDALSLPLVPKGDREDVPNVNFHLRGPEHNFISEEHGRNYMHAYYAAVHFVDALAGRLIDELEVLGLKDNTIIVFTSDQGFLLGEHGHWHKSTLFEESCRVPLIIVDPRREQTAAVCEGFAGLVDLYPTLCELAGIEPPHALSGLSLAPQLDDAALPTKPFELTQGKPGAYSLRSERYRYTIWKNKKGHTIASMLYDLKADPNEFTNLSLDPKHAGLAKQLDDQLSEWMECKLNK